MHPADYPVRYLRYRSTAGWEPVDDRVIAEAAVELAVNGQPWLSFACTPTRLDALAAGFLFNEGVIQSRAEIAAVDVCPQGDHVDVWLEHPAERPAFWQRTSGCTGGVTGVGADENEAIGPGEPEAVLEPEEVASIEPEMLLLGMERLLAAQDLYREAGGVHSSALYDGQIIRAQAEDIGRHNTLDKLAGILLLEEIVLKRAILFTTGRISSEMLQKSARLGASVVVSRTSPTSQSVFLARQKGITLVGYARRNGFQVYTHAARIRLQGDAAR